MKDRIDDGAILVEYVETEATEQDVESGASPTSILIVPMLGVKPKTIEKVNNSKRPWAALRTAKGVEPMKPVTMRTLLVTDEPDWKAEESIVADLVHTHTLRKATLIVPAEDGSILSYVMPEPSIEDESYLIGI